MLELARESKSLDEVPLGSSCNQCLCQTHPAGEGRCKLIEAPCEASPGRPVAEAGTTMVPMVCVSNGKTSKVRFFQGFKHKITIEPVRFTLVLK
jgi:hypothetical protein